MWAARLQQDGGAGWARLPKKVKKRAKLGPVAGNLVGHAGQVKAKRGLDSTRSGGHGGPASSVELVEDKLAVAEVAQCDLDSSSSDGVA
eukprot:5080870-Amphidinium_carterae.1